MRKILRRGVTELWRIVAIFTHFVKQRERRRPLSISPIFPQNFSAIFSKCVNYVTFYNNYVTITYLKISKFAPQELIKF
jgi:hypothetical protein